VMVDNDGAEPQTAIKQLSGGPNHLVHWLTTLFDRSSWQPSGIVIVGADYELDALSTRLEAAVPVPVISQPGAELVLARGAALASAQSTEFTDAEMLETVNSWRQDGDAARKRSYAGAVTILAAGAATFVASLSLALGPHLVPNHAPDPVRPFAHLAARAPIAEAQPSAVVTPPARPAPKPAPAREPVVEQQHVVAQAPVEVPAVAPPAPPPPPVAPPPEPPPNPHPLLTKLWLRMHGQDPDQQQPPPPPPGAPTP